MVKLVDKQNIFNHGILSSKLYSRDDLKQYVGGVADALNFVCSRYGPLEKRVGTTFVWNLDRDARELEEDVFFLPFVFSVEQSVLLEFRPYKIRFYAFDNVYGKDFGAIRDPVPIGYDDVTGEPIWGQYEISTPFTAAQIKSISYVQSLDVLYLAFSDGKTPPYTLSRYAFDSWVLSKFVTEDGPYLDQNFSTNKKVQITDVNTVTSTVALQGFTLGAGDIGRWIRICTPRYNDNTYAYEDKWSYGKISAIGDEIWSIQRRTIYTAVLEPAVGAVTYTSTAKTGQFGKITAKGASGETPTITVNGRVFLYQGQVQTDTYAWQESSVNAYVNESQAQSTYIYTTVEAPGTQAVYASQSTSDRYQIGGTNQSVVTKTYKELKAGVAASRVLRITAGVWFRYVSSSKVGSTTWYKWVRCNYFYSNSSYSTSIGQILYKNTSDDYIVQLDSNYYTPSTTSVDTSSTLKRAGDTITVKWSYRNIVEEDDQDWMMQATSEWRLGVWHDATGNSDYPVTYPTKVAIHQQRLVWAGMTDRPWVWMSNSYAYKNYAPSDFEGVIADTNSIYLDISTDKVSEIFWMKSMKHLLLGTELGELRVYSSGTALSPSDAVSNRESSYGSFNAEPIVNDDNIVFIQRLQRTVRSLAYDDNKLAYVGPELTILAENLTAGGIKKIVFQKEPNNTYWCLKEDGTLLTLTYDASQDVIGWSKSQLAGDARVIDLAVLPSNTYQQDMVLLAVERVIDGQKVRYLELLSKNFMPGMEHKEALYLDCAYREQRDTEFSTIDGLDFLEGQEVVVTDEGAYAGTYTVEDGQIQLDNPCKDVWVGLPYSAYFETLERDYQDKQISTKMSKLRVYKLRMYLDRTIGLSLYRMDRGSTSRLVTFNPTGNMDETSELITGKVTIDVYSAWDCDYKLKVISDVGMPCTVAGITIGLELNEI